MSANTLLSELMIKREWALQMSGKYPFLDSNLLVSICPLKAEYFSDADRALSLDDFSRKQGWTE